MLSTLQTAFENGERVSVPAGVIGQAWRDPNRQVLLARTLKLCEEMPLDGPIARSAGQLCGQTGTADVIDASVAVLVEGSNHTDRDIVLLTSDTKDLRILLSALGTGARVVEV